MYVKYITFFPHYNMFNKKREMINRKDRSIIEQPKTAEKKSLLDGHGHS